MNNWNEARAEGERSRGYLSRIRAELVADMTELGMAQGPMAVGRQRGVRGSQLCRDGRARWRN